MTYFLLLLIVADQLLEAIMSKQYNINAKKINVILYSGVSCLFALLFFVANSGGKLDFNPKII